MKLLIANRTRPRVGETACGDRIVVRTEGTHTLLVVIDALGHGEPASEVATAAARVAREVEIDRGALHVMHAMHEALHGSRGAGAMVCVLERYSLQGCGVGNVELRTSPRQVPSVLSPGILGANVRSFKVFEGTLAPRSRLMMFSDGIAASRLATSQLGGLTPDDACAHVLASCAHDHDDAAILIADVPEEE